MIAADRPEVTEPGEAQRGQRRIADPPDAQHRDVVGRDRRTTGVARTVSYRPPTWTSVSLSPATTWALVTTRPPGRDPARALDPQPAGRAGDPHDRALASRGPAGRARIAPRRRRHVGRRAVDLRQRVEAGQRLEDRARRRQHVVEPAAGSPSGGRPRGRCAAPASAAPRRRRSRPARARRSAVSSGAEEPVDDAEAAEPEASPHPGAEPLEPERRTPRRARRPRRAPSAARRASGCRRRAAAGPARVPRNAPSANPASESAPTMNPCRNP